MRSRAGQGQRHHDLGRGAHDLGRGAHDLGRGADDLDRGAHDLGRGVHDPGHEIDVNGPLTVETAPYVKSMSQKRRIYVHYILRTYSTDCGEERTIL